MTDGTPVRQSISIDISDEGLAATHPAEVDFPRAVATAQPGSPEHNSLRDFLQVVGCAMFPDLTFQFDSSLVGPDVRKATRRLALFRTELKDAAGQFPPLALFGHADPVGKLAYNSALSARRALCIYGMLLRRIDIWEGLFNDKGVAGDIWGDEEFDTMLDEVGFPPELPRDNGDPAQRKAILARLRRSGFDRARLFGAYIDAVCVQEDGRGGDQPFVLKAADFLDRGAHADHKGAVQGCGEFNPVFIMARQRERAFDRSGDRLGRDAANEPNRRVLAFLFKPGTRIVPDQWPCPSTHQKQPEAACTKRLWKDKDRRLRADELEDRSFKRSADTMGCRFYHAFAQNSPCEGTLKLWVLRIGFDDDLKKDSAGQVIEDAKGRNTLGHPIARKRYVVDMGADAGAPVIRGRTDDKGGIRLPVFDDRTTMSLKIDARSLLDPQDPDGRQKTEADTPEEDFIELTLKAGDLFPIAGQQPEVDEIAAFQRLSNLAYGPPRPIERWTEEERREAVSAFQRKHGLQDSGQLGGADLAALRRVHGS